ncbi:hypothetical protein [Tautonia plasticadhaerens]|uniref:Uncharacterized protein n=1 Tax=Tautonia plasticadhaerens TaxID=2527974 RepID=A0A518H9W7_9BACT|nr:hypothetical protein [Tautonia plasticadhaerens]QDV37536.1 hypothetical protein ElP_54760 [Tautonia plasticadhaerens]
MYLIIERDGSVRGIYGEEIALDALGQPKITRASHVEPDDQGRWLADLSPVGGPVLGPFDGRSEALEAEVAWLEEHWLEARREARFPIRRAPGHAAPLAARPISERWGVTRGAVVQGHELDRCGD